MSINGEVIFSSTQGSLDQWLSEAYDFLNPQYPKFYKMDRLSKLGFLASALLLKDRKLTNEYPAGKIGVILSNASSSLETDRKFMKSTNAIASPALFVYTLPNIVIGEICIYHGLKGENAFFVFDHFNPDFLTSYIDQVMQGGAESCISGWVENNGEAYDVFLYLTEKGKGSKALEHTSSTVSELYNQ